MGKIKIIYIASSARSGSTILGRMMGQLENIVHVGEIGYIWERGVEENWLCSCGYPFSECSFWNRIISDITLDGTIPIEEFKRYNFQSKNNNKKFLRFRDLVFAPERWYKKNKYLISSNIKQCENIYSKVLDYSKAEIIIDSSKSPEYAFYLLKSENIDLYVIHLVRDLRAVLFSQVIRKKKLISAKNKISFQQRPGKGIKPYLETIFYWYFENSLIRKLLRKKAKKYVTIRYEDLTKNPQKILDKLSAFAELKEINSIIDENNIVDFKKSEHLFSGNSDRMNKGQLKIKEDREWKDKMEWSVRFLLSILYLPGYIRNKLLIL